MELHLQSQSALNPDTLSFRVVMSFSVLERGGRVMVMTHADFNDKRPC